jgi:hypothetical protein
MKGKRKERERKTKRKKTRKKKRKKRKEKRKETKGGKNAPKRMIKPSKASIAASSRARAYSSTDTSNHIKTHTGSPELNVHQRVG